MRAARHSDQVLIHSKVQNGKGGQGLPVKELFLSLYKTRGGTYTRLLGLDLLPMVFLSEEHRFMT